MSALDFPLFVGKYVKGTIEQQSLLSMRLLIFQRFFVVVFSTQEQIPWMSLFYFIFFAFLTQQRPFYIFIVDLDSNLSPVSLHRWLCLCGDSTLWWPCFWAVSLEVSSCSAQFCPSCCCLLLGTAGSQIASWPLGSPSLWCVHQLSLCLAYFCVPDGL